MCFNLELQLNFDPSTLRDFESRVRHDFTGPGPYPTVVLSPTTPAPFAHNANPSSSIPSFTTCISLLKVIPSLPLAYPSSPLDKPEASHSASTSPASLVSPQTTSTGLDLSRSLCQYFFLRPVAFVPHRLNICETAPAVAGNRTVVHPPFFGTPHTAPLLCPKVCVRAHFYSPHPC
jgi:hypothetical protein